MAQSLAPECTSLKLKYDACFNSWFEGYLEPAVAVPSTDRAAYARAKAEEYDRKCGAVWGSYRACVEKAMEEKGLSELVVRAREASTSG
ncbi:mitochondrial distribution/morphology family 35/apoptosis [Vararia minispora EC-137]|uniref:Mitochondrial distribution/morphology family 35/apoptosis n=1 Tax=Vararia minispora EC-137 TaxID=1314806 RepID=A0ACB8QG46_9AGAM|nr:mitochondrial distribution/morphology family 35/apoptosis [Vararia minispora EC-137]